MHKVSWHPFHSPLHSTATFFHELCYDDDDLYMHLHVTYLNCKTQLMFKRYVWNKILTRERHIGMIFLEQILTRERHKEKICL